MDEPLRDELEDRKAALRFRVKRKEAMRRLDMALEALAKTEGKPKPDSVWPSDWQ